MTIEQKHRQTLIISNECMVHKGYCKDLDPNNCF